MKILVTGAAGFIAGYLISTLLEAGHEVVGLDNFWKYGPVTRGFDSHPNYQFIEGDAKDVDLLKEAMSDCDQVVAGAAIIGGISMFHALAYELLAENERISAATFDAAIWAFQNRRLKKINVISSSMVFESATEFPTPEEAVLTCPPPRSTYGLQKLVTEYFARGAWEQFQLPYTICRPFNCVGIGERRALTEHSIQSGNVKLAMSHVVPDLVQKLLRGQDPLHILGSGNQIRHYTYGGDLAAGIQVCIEHPAALNEDFNLSTNQGTTVLELAEIIWKKIRGDKPFRYVSDKPFEYDVQKRIPDTRKAERMLGFKAETGLEEALDEIIPWIDEELKAGRI